MRKKKLVFILLGTLFVGAPVAYPVYIWTFIGSHQDKLRADRCNSAEMQEEMFAQNDRQQTSARSSHPREKETPQMSRLS